MTDIDEIKKYIQEAAENKDGKYYLACPKAFSLAKKHKLKIRDVGNACNELKIKICGCQLGCFK